RVAVPALVVVKARDRDRQYPAEYAQRIMSPLSGDEGVPHRDSLAKNAVAFFKISRSILSVAFSARSRESSLSAAPTGTRLAELNGLPSREVRSQLASVLAEMSSRRAASAAPSDSPNSTAWALKSSV